MRAREAMRLFGATGPVRPADHHRIPPIERSGLDDTQALAPTRRSRNQTIGFPLPRE